MDLILLLIFVILILFNIIYKNNNKFNLNFPKSRLACKCDKNIKEDFEDFTPKKSFKKLKLNSDKKKFETAESNFEKKYNYPFIPFNQNNIFQAYNQHLY